MEVFFTTTRCGAKSVEGTHQPPTGPVPVEAVIDSYVAPPSPRLPRHQSSGLLPAAVEVGITVTRPAAGRSPEDLHAEEETSCALGVAGQSALHRHGAGGGGH